ncbi:restriction endonuclease subunit S [Aeromonas veronii]|uniref:restriction endonuclease subunit S n=1 Tax=Aeromonas veronii TaxID=654 RepID=UPI001F46D9CD|nr:restriction endonuclease subunit S [Aeromonas veronii]MCF5892571.1 restriction endonuclease subunit S [Aeromonas veronii]
MAIENLITDHLDLWTAAVRPKSSAGRGSNSKLELTGIKKLRELILELAVRGKLVPQDPSDEPASVLLERITAEKAQLVKEGKIKKPKALPEISEEEQYFELPTTWGWVRLNDIADYNGRPNIEPDNIKGDVWLLDLEDIEKDTSQLLYRAFYAERESKSNKSTFKCGDVLYGKLRPYLNKVIIADLDGVCTTEIVPIVPGDGLHPAYLKYLLKSPAFQRYVNSLMYGVKMPRLGTEDAIKSVHPLPPLAEQHRIVAKVDELMALCDQLELRSESQLAAHQTLVETLLATLTDCADADELAQSWARLSTHFDTLFTTEASIDALKQTILQLAVMGKLVPQDPSDEPASALLERIAAEKAQLVKEKKIKKEKPLPAISEDEKPFELPLGWVWSRISESSLFCEYGSSEKTVSELSDGVPVLKMGDIQDGKVILGSHQVVSPKIDDLPNLYLKKGDILYNRTNSAELVGKTGMFDGDDDTYTFASYLIRIRCSIHNIRPEYLTLCMNSPLFRKTQIEPHIKQQCGQANVNGTLMKSMLVSIPPYHEQVLILQKIHELMTLCDQLKSRLQTSQQTQLALAESLVEGALT